MVQQIEISKLYPHPDNPRKNVGDVTELADSLKQNGVYQNLTVIAGGKGVPEGVDGYTVIIGHRRLEAAKQAGLTALPCSIAEMSETKQVETMLLENMQRSDLTVYEQAQGFQMLIDLGETQQSIAEKTGFSPATVSRRIKLLQIRSAAFEKTQGKNISMEDYLRIAELKSKSAQKEALEAAGTNNFEWTMRRLMKEQLKNEVLPKIEKELKAEGARPIKDSDRWNGTYDQLKTVFYEGYEEGTLKKGIKKEKEIFYYVRDEGVTLYKKRQKTAPTKTEKSEEEKKADKVRRELDKVTKQAFEMRRDFIKSFSAAIKYADVISSWAVKSIAFQSSDYTISFNREFMKEAIGQESGYYVDENIIEKFITEEPQRASALIVWCNFGDCSSHRYYDQRYYTHLPTYQKNKQLDRVYEFLCALGYEMSDEELQLQNGTHPLFKGEEK